MVDLAASKQFSLVMAADQILGDGETFFDRGVYDVTRGQSTATAAVSQTFTTINGSSTLYLIFSIYFSFVFIQSCWRLARIILVSPCPRDRVPDWPSRSISLGVQLFCLFVSHLRPMLASTCKVTKSTVCSVAILSF